MNDECRMWNDEVQKDEMEAGALFMVFFIVISHSFELRHSSFESAAPAHA
jgi:hypothetical protein